MLLNMNYVRKQDNDQVSDIPTRLYAITKMRSMLRQAKQICELVKAYSARLATCGRSPPTHNQRRYSVHNV